MKRKVMAALLAAAGLVAGGLPASAGQSVLVRDWRFSPDGSEGPQYADYDDRRWQVVSVPHDFSISSADGRARSDPKTPSGAYSGYIPGGAGWYRRHFSLDADQAHGVVRLKFEAAYMDAGIWVNGAYVGAHHYGYSAFAVDLTGKVHAGDNVVSVRIQHDDPSSRWYAGSGLIRPVTLETLARIHADPDGATIRTPVALPDHGEVHISTTVQNGDDKPADVSVSLQILDARGKVVAAAENQARIEAGQSLPVARDFTIAHPALWSTEAPNLYRLEQVVSAEGRVVDRRTTTFGIRTITVDAQHGLRINGERVLLRGGNIHHDNYMLGAAGVPRADERKLELMKAAGYNAVRNAHNPASQATLDAADRLGMLVIDEAFDSWVIPKMPRDYSRFFPNDWQSDLDSLIATGRNHPSVVMWSIGNEIPEQATPEGAARARLLAQYVRQRDPTRPITAAVNSEGEKVAGFFAALDVSGYNYRPEYYGPDHLTYPDRVMFGTESYPDQAFDYWRPTDTMPWVIGDFVWTAFDYLGEASIGWTGYSSAWRALGPYPWQLAYCGEIDATGRRRPASYYREILWDAGPTKLAAFVRFPEAGGALPDGDYFGPKANRQWVLPDVHESWTWPGYEGRPLDVVVYSRAPEVELLLNGKSLGRKAVNAQTRYEAHFQAPYAPGVLRAVGYKDGRKIAEWTLETAGKPAQVRLSVDHGAISADGLDVAYVVAELVDAKGRKTYIRADDRQLRFEISGAGTLTGVGNGDPVSTESLSSDLRTTFHGRAVAVVRGRGANGLITVKVSADGLPAATLSLQAGS